MSLIPCYSQCIFFCICSGFWVWSHFTRQLFHEVCRPLSVSASEDKKKLLRMRKSKAFTTINSILKWPTDFPATFSLYIQITLHSLSFLQFPNTDFVKIVPPRQNKFFHPKGQCLIEQDFCPHVTSHPTQASLPPAIISSAYFMGLSL